MSKMKKVVKHNVYLDILLMVSIYVTNLPLCETSHSGFLELPIWCPYGQEDMSSWSTSRRVSLFNKKKSLLVEQGDLSSGSIRRHVVRLAKKTCLHAQHKVVSFCPTRIHVFLLSKKTVGQQEVFLLEQMTCPLVGREDIFLLDQKTRRRVGLEGMPSCWTRRNVFLLAKKACLGGTQG